MSLLDANCVVICVRVNSMRLVTSLEISSSQEEEKKRRRENPSCSFEVRYDEMGGRVREK